MDRQTIEKAAKEAVQNNFQCNGKYPCKERNYCKFCNGHNSAFDCNEDCGADDFNEGFIAGVEWLANYLFRIPFVEIIDELHEYCANKLKENSYDKGKCI